MANTGVLAATISNSGGNQTIAAPIVLGSNLSVTDTAGSVLTIAQTISETGGSRSLSVSGGELILSGTSSYTGGTTVSGGTLEVTAAKALASSGLVTISGGGRLVLGSGSGIGALISASSPISSGEVALSAAAATQSPLSIAARDEDMATLGGAPAISQGVAGSAVGGSAAAAVPEPGTLALFGVRAAITAAAGAAAKAVARGNNPQPLARRFQRHVSPPRHTHNVVPRRIRASVDLHPLRGPPHRWHDSFPANYRQVQGRFFPVGNLTAPSGHLRRVADGHSR